jgi:peroxiredoxin Q/BCP
MKQAPDFSLQDQDGKTVSLADYAGKWLVLYFYPKDDTPGCTTEACTFRDEREAIAEFGNAEIIGISKDSVQSHKKFTDKHHLNFTLLSDPDHSTAEAYDSWKLKKFMGREYMGMERNTFIVDPTGKIAKEYRGVDPKVHAAQIIVDLKSLQYSRSDISHA